VIKYETLLAGVEEAPVFGNDVDPRTRATIWFAVKCDAAMEETTTCDSGFVVADADGTSVAGVNAHPRVVANHERHRAPVAESECVCRTRSFLVPTRDYEAVVGGIPMHSERHAALFDAGVRDE
jgi:hypothetical protein